MLLLKIAIYTKVAFYNIRGVLVMKEVKYINCKVFKEFAQSSQRGFLERNRRECKFI